MRRAGTETVAFGPFLLDLAGRSLTRGGEEIVLGARAFDVLAALATEAGRTVTKDALLAAAWSGVVVEENNLQVQVSTLRKRLGEAWIITVPGRGYRLAIPPHAGSPPDMEAGETPGLPSIAVLPFENLSGDPQQAWLSDGIAEDILTELSRDRRLFVIGRASSFTFRDAGADPAEAGRRLGVRYLLDGTARRAGARLRVTARLNDATTGGSLWAGRFDRQVDDVFAVQDEIAAAVLAAVIPALAAAEQRRARRRPPRGLTAWEAYQRGIWHISQGTEHDLRSALDLFRQSAAIDRDFAPAYIGQSQAIAYLASRHQALAWAEAGRQMVELARMAAACDPLDAEAVAMLAEGLVFLGDLDAAMATIETARRLDPTSLMALGLQARLQCQLGWLDEGLANLDVYLRQNPLDPTRRMAEIVRMRAAYERRDYEAVVAQARRVIAASADPQWVFRHLAAALGQLGRLDEARPALQAATADARHFDAYVRHGPPWHRRDYRDHLIDGLRKAGWEG